MWHLYMFFVFLYLNQQRFVYHVACVNVHVESETQGTIRWYLKDNQRTNTEYKHEFEHPFNENMKTNILWSLTELKPERDRKDPTDRPGWDRTTNLGVHSNHDQSPPLPQSVSPCTQ